jgi:hypothetical protein
MARIVDDTPGAQLTGVNGTTVSVSVNPRGNDTQLTATAVDARGRTVATRLPPPSGGVMPVTVDVSFAGLAAGDYTVRVTSANARGDGPALAAPMHVAPAPAKKLRLADLVSLASTRRCVATRVMKLTLHKPKAGVPTVASLRIAVGKAKAKTYTSRQLTHPLALRGFPKKGRVALRVEARLSDGTRLVRTSTYRICGAMKRR